MMPGSSSDSRMPTRRLEVLHNPLPPSQIAP
jgi:hypothetical protein